MKNENNLANNFHDKLLEAIISKDINFIRENSNKINFENYSTNSSLKKWNENAILNNLIANGFTEGFKIIIDKFYSQIGFTPFDGKKFHYVIINICYYAKKELIEYIIDKYNFDPTVYDEDGLGLIHYVFEAAINNETATISEEEIFEICSYLQENQVNIFDVYPLDKEFSEERAMSLTRKSYHNIFTYLITFRKFKSAIKLIDLLPNKNILTMNLKIDELILFLYRNYIFNCSLILESDPENYERIDWDAAVDLFVYFINEMDDLTISILKNTNFLFEISHFNLTEKLTEKSKNKIMQLFLNEERKNDGMFSALSNIIFDNFKHLDFFIFFEKLSNENMELIEYINNENNSYIDDIVSSFQKQKRPPNKLVLEEQLNFIKLINKEILSKKDKNGYSYLDFLNFTIESWRDIGFNITNIKV